LECLSHKNVQFILIGGVAANLHGSSRATFDLDIIYSRSEENLKSLVAALAPFQPYLRGAPPGLPFRWDIRTLKTGLNFTLTTSLGALDLLAEVPGGGTFELLVPDSEWFDFGSVRVRCANLEQLIELKAAAGRPKDFESVAELRAIQQEKKR
jgi:predicted nucleotidyltransferase